MQQCAEHVDFQLPNEHTRVGYLIESIENSDALLQAALALVQNDTAPTGKRNDFEAAAAFLLPHDPVAKKRASAKRTHAEVSAIDGSSIRSGKGKSGVEFRYHTKQEYKKLSTEQRNELREWRLENDGNQSPKRAKMTEQGSKVTFANDKKFKKAISEAVVAELTSIDEKKTKAEAENKVEGALLSLMEAAVEARVKSFVFSSSLLVYANLRATVDVYTPADPILDYGRIKLETEKKMTEIAASGGITSSSRRDGYHT